MTYIFALLALVVAWNLAPMLMLCALPILVRHKLRGCKSFAGSALRGLLVLPPDLLAPGRAICAAPDRLGCRIVARWARWWDNDVSINGDHQVPSHTCRHARGPRSVLLRRPPPAQLPRPVGVAGLRNRASALAAMLGRKLTPAEVQDADTWGDETIGKAKEGWCVRRNGASVPALHHPQDRPAVPACALRAISSTTPASGAARQWWSTSALA